VATITTLGFTIFSTYDGRGVDDAKNSVQSLSDSLDKNSDAMNRNSDAMANSGDESESSSAKFKDAATSMFSLSSAALAFSPALYSMGGPILAVAAGLGVMGIAAGAAGGLLLGAFEAAYKGTDASAKAMQADVAGLKTSFTSFGNEVAPMLKNSFGTAISAAEAAMHMFVPAVAALAPVANDVANAVSHWVHDGGLQEWISWVASTGKVILEAFIVTARNLGTVFGDLLRAFSPMATAMAEGMARISGQMATWANGGGFEKFLDTVRSMAPAVEGIFKDLWDLTKNLGAALLGLGPVSLSVTGELLKLAAALPPGVLQAIIVGILAYRAAMLASAAATSIATAASKDNIVGQTLMKAADLASAAGSAIAAAATYVWDAALIIADGSMIIAVGIIGLLVIAIAAIGFGIYELVTHWTTVWNTIKSVFDTVVAFLRTGFGTLVLLLTGPIAPLLFLALHWQQVWAGMQVVAAAVWNFLKSAWTALVDFFAPIWNAVAAALTPLWTTVWNVIKTVAQTVWAFLQTAWQIFINSLAVIWNAVSSAISVTWNAFWTLIKTVAQAIWSVIQAAWQAFINVLQAIWNVFVAFFTGNWSALWNDIKAVGVAIWNGLQAVWQTFINALETIWTAFGNFITTAWNAVWSAIKTVASTIWEAIQAAWSALIQAVETIYNTFATVIAAAWNAFWTGLKTIAVDIWNALQAAWQAFVSAVQTAYNTFASFITNAWNAFWNDLKTIATTIWDFLKAAWSDEVNGWKEVWDTVSAALKSAWNTFWNDLKTIATDIWSFLKTAWSDEVNGWKEVWDTISAAIKSSWNTFWNDLKTIATTIWDFLKTAWSDEVNGWKEVWDTVSAALKTAWNDFWNAIKTVATDVWDALKTGWDDFSKGVQDTLSALVSAAETIWNKIVDIFKTPVNAVISIWDTVAGAVGLPNISKLAHGGYIPMSAPGTPTNDRVPAMLSAGEYVMPADTVAHYGLDAMQGIHAKRFAGGGIVDPNPTGGSPGGIGGGGGVGSGGGTTAVPGQPNPVGGGGSSTGGAGGNPSTPSNGAPNTPPSGSDPFNPVLTKLENIAKDVVYDTVKPFITAIMGAVPDPDPAGTPKPAGDVVNSGMKKITDGVLSKLQDAETAAKQAASFSQAVGAIPTSAHQSIIDQALSAAGIPPPGTLSDWEIGFNTLITRESGWDPNAINETDSNAQAGHPSQGLAQTIPSTFEAYHVAGTSDNILDPVANIAAAARYIVATYGNITNVQQAFGATPQGYALGTSSASPGWAMVGEDGPEWVNFGGGEQVLPNGVAPSLTGNGPVVVNVTNNFNGDNVDKAAVEQYTETDMVDQLRQAVVAGVGTRNH
jgi:SLT domain-containing protein/phage-related protein